MSRLTKRTRSVNSKDMKELTLREHLSNAGRATSEKKTAAARINGAKGGRPKKNKTRKPKNDD